MAKVGRPKHIQPHEAVFIIPKDGLHYQAKRAYWLMRQYEKVMAKDITAIPAKDYNAAVENFVKLSEELKKSGYYRAKNGKATKNRILAEDVAQDGGQDSTADLGGEGSASLGAGIHADNPLA